MREPPKKCVADSSRGEEHGEQDDAVLLEALRALGTAIADVVRTLETHRAAPEREAWIGVGAAAAYTGCSEESIRELIASGALPHGKIGARGIRVRRSDIDRALLAQAREEPSQVQDRVARILRSVVPKR
jgi:excisionase family DNA binding protein